MIAARAVNKTRALPDSLVKQPVPGLATNFILVWIARKRSCPDGYWDYESR
jgi:hypothetical protein